MFEQQLYELRKQLSLSQTMEKEYMIELEFLQKKYETDIATERAKLKALEEKNTVHRNKLMLEVESLEQERKAETEMNKKQSIQTEERVKILQEQLKNLSEINNSSLVQQLQSENGELREKVLHLSEECSHLQEENNMYLRREDEINNELGDLKERIKMHREDLTANSDAIMKLQEEKMLLKAEIHMLQSKPQTTDQKGNSLFAEVEDKRKSMKKSLEISISKYRHMKKLYADKCAEATKYRAEYVFLCRKFEEMETALKEEDKQLIIGFKARIKFLEEDVAKLTRSKPPFIIQNADNHTLKFIEAYAESSRKECENLKNELEAMSVRSLFRNETLHDTKRQLHKTEIELMQARGKIVKLQGILEEKNNSENPDD